jgi:hypothetical protein
MTEFVIELDHRPGTLARLAEILAEAGINVEGLAAWGADGRGIVRLVVDDHAGARRVLRLHGLRIAENPVLRTTVSHRPGALAELTRALADADVNVEALYVLHTSDVGVDLAIVVDDPDAVRPLLAVRG